MPLAEVVLTLLVVDDSEVWDDDGVMHRWRALASSYDFWAGDRMKYDDCGRDDSRGWLS